jgi:hypothetical protein
MLFCYLTTRPPKISGCLDEPVEIRRLDVRNLNKEMVKPSTEEMLRSKGIIPEGTELHFEKFYSRCNKRGSGGRLYGKFALVKDGMIVGRGTVKGNLFCAPTSVRVLDLTTSVTPFKRPRPIR